MTLRNDFNGKWKMGYYLANMKQLTEDTQEHIQMASVFMLEIMISF